MRGPAGEVVDGDRGCGRIRCPASSAHRPHGQEAAAFAADDVLDEDEEDDSDDEEDEEDEDDPLEDDPFDDDPLEDDPPDVEAFEEPFDELARLSVR